MGLIGKLLSGAKKAKSSYESFQAARLARLEKKVEFQKKWAAAKSAQIKAKTDVMKAKEQLSALRQKRVEKIASILGGASPNPQRPVIVRPVVGKKKKKVRVVYVKQKPQQPQEKDVFGFGGHSNAGGFRW